jgi:methylisocitrate lyase
MSDGTVVAPTVYDMVAAKIAVSAGFNAVFCGGYGQAASALGVPDTGLLPLEVLIERVEAMTSSVDVPVLVDADTGFGDPQAACSKLIAAGASAIVIEDQVTEKRCGHSGGKQVVSASEMIERLNGCISGRTAGVPIIARTDAIQPLGIDEAINRGHAYLEAGADVLFIEAPRSMVEIRQIASEFDRPLLFDVLPGGVSPPITLRELQGLGFKMVVFALVDLMLATAALSAGFAQLARTGDAARLETPLLPLATLNRITGLD